VVRGISIRFAVPNLTTKQFMAERSTKIHLRGVNLGGWLVLENG
jgi:hypothetical protein